MPPDGSPPTEDPRRRLEALFAAYPLPEGWGRPEVFLEQADVAGVRIHLTGLCASSADGSSMTGSAASVDQAPVERAYFELLERVSLADAVARPRARYALFDEYGRRTGSCEHASVFPANAPGASFRYALSNGVAAGSSFEVAARAAFHELVERDRILRSWYGEFSPVRVVEPRLGALERLHSVYRFETIVFPRQAARRGDALHVVAVFGFPRGGDAPLIRGMGAGDSQNEAEARAVRECLQNLGFLWGEPTPDSEPEFSTTAEYHQEYYLWPKSQARLERWFRGEHGRARTNLSHRVARRSPLRFADLTPPHLFGRFVVVKALPDDELPVVFGSGHPNVPEAITLDLGVHPVS